MLADDEGINLPLIQDSSGPTGGLNLLFDIQTVGGKTHNKSTLLRTL